MAQIDSKKLRDNWVAKKALYEQNLARSEQNLLRIREGLSRLEEKDLDLLMDRGIDVRSLLQYDMTLIASDEEYFKKFKYDIERILALLSDLFNKESGM